MKIASEYKDYYDVAIGSTADESYTFQRACNSYDLPSHPIAEKIGQELIGIHDTIDRYRYVVSTLAIGFCGEIFPLVEFSSYDGKSKKYLYNSNDFSRELNKIPQECNEYETCYPKRHSATDNWTYGYVHKRSYSKWNETTISEYFEISKWQGLYEDLFKEYSAPIFLVEDGDTGIVLRTNPVLENLQFVKLIDPYTAVQRISSFMKSIEES